MQVRVHVDADLCEGNAVCEGIAPEYFHLDDDDTLRVWDAEVPPEGEPGVRRAVRSCPRQALSVTE